MKRLSILKLAMLIALLPFAETNAQQMFRGAADHNYHVNSASTKPFTQLAWKFDAEAPIRSTVAVSNQGIFFGSSKGLFYCLDKANGKLKWSFNAGAAIHSSAALDGVNVFFSDNRQTLYSLNANTGKLNWKTSLGLSKNYDWAFDYFYSSPTILNHHVFIGSKDGCVYSVDELTGKINWKFKTRGVVRSSPAVSVGTVYVGDTDGSLFAINSVTGKQIWSFSTIGHELKNENFGFDRRAIIASPLVTGNKVIVGSRDGFLYAVDKQSGKELWQVDHQVSWIISSVAVINDIVITGTSDGRFVQAIGLQTGKQLWKHKLHSIVWSSPFIDGDKVYVGSHDGLLYCFELKTGKLIDSFQAGGIIFSSPIISGTMLYFGCDDGMLYALKPNTLNQPAATAAKKYVFWESGSPYYHYGTDVRIRQYLTENGYKLLNKDKLIALFQKSDSAANTVVVFANDLFPPETTEGLARSPLRNYLNNGGKVVVTGINPLMFKIDPKDKSMDFRSYLFPDSVISIKYGPDDLRSYKGNQPAFPTKTGLAWGLKGFWAAPLSLPASQVDIVLGMDENGLASAWVKKFNPAPGSGFVQIWIDENTTDLSSLTRVAEYGLK